MEDVSLTTEAVDEEIELTKEVIAKFKSKLNELKEKNHVLTNRLNVLRTVEEKLPEGSTKQINHANINIVAEERWALLPEINRQDSTIKHYEQILATLIEIRNEMKK